MGCETVVDVISSAIVVEPVLPITEVEVVDPQTTVVDVSIPSTVVVVDPAAVVVEVGLVVQQVVVAPLILVAGEDLTAGDVVALNGSGEAVKADATFSADLYRVIGLAKTTVSSGTNVSIESLHGVKAAARFVVAPGAGANGDYCYLSETPGQLQTAAPTAAGVAVVVVGVVQDADGVDTTPEIIVLPEFIEVNP